MEDIEARYRKTKVTHKKYRIRLSKFIDALLKKERYIEAQYYFSELMNMTGMTVQTAEIGYQVALRCFDSEKAAIFDDALQNKISVDTLLFYRLQYYYSFNRKILFIDTLRELLTYKISEPILEKVFSLVMINAEYISLKLIIFYLIKNNKILNDKADRHAKIVAIQELVNLLSRRING